MCGRFVGFRKIEQLKQYFPIDQADVETTANFNVAPTHEILAIVRHDGLNVLEKLHWGLVPFWAKDIKIGYKMINARYESVAIKPSFREPFKRRRCLILADGFYEWKGTKGQKQPVFITLPNGDPFAFAGLWETWHDKEKAGDAYRSCAIITRDASPSMQQIHNRMPVILNPAVYASWLDPENQDTDQLQNVLMNQSVTELIFHPVSKQVNSVVNNDPANIKPVQTEFAF